MARRRWWWWWCWCTLVVVVLLAAAEEDQQQQQPPASRRRHQPSVRYPHLERFVGKMEVGGYLDEDDDDDDFFDDEEDDEEQQQQQLQQQQQYDTEDVVDDFMMRHDARVRDAIREMMLGDEEGWVVSRQHDYVDDWDEVKVEAAVTDGPMNDSPSTVRPSSNKWVYYGTKDDLRPSGPSVKLKQHEISEVLQHTMRVSNEGVCKHPKQKVVDIQSYYPNHSKTYIPHCTLLYKCGEDTGCCKSKYLTCKTKLSDTIELYFQTFTVGQRGNVIEKLTFVNDTECECVPKKFDFMFEDENLSPIAFRPETNYKKLVGVPEVETSAPETLKKCRCPTEFSVHVLEGGGCECDCFNRQKVCMRIKKGKEHFGMKDRVCIMNGECGVPKCEFGEYVTDAGRCPRKQGRSGEVTNHSRLFRNN